MDGWQKREKGDGMVMVMVMEHGVGHGVKRLAPVGSSQSPGHAHRARPTNDRCRASKMVHKTRILVGAGGPLLRPTCHLLRSYAIQTLDTSARNSVLCCSSPLSSPRHSLQ